MSATEILQALEYFSSDFPYQALEAASEQKEELIPLLLAKLEGWKGQFCDLSDDYYLHIYSFFLLAEFREKKAYPLIIDLLIEAGDETYTLFGDFITEELATVLASVYDGNLEPLFHLIDTAPDEYVQGAGIKALVILYLDGQLSRQDVLNYLEKIGRQCLASAEDDVDENLAYIAGNVVCKIIDIHGTELKGLSEELFDANIVDEWLVNRGDVEQGFAEHTLETALAALRDQKRYQLIGSTVESMKNWFCFKSEEEQKQDKEKFNAALRALLNERVSVKQRDPINFGSPTPSEEVFRDKTNPQKKAKQKQQKLSRKKNRQKKKR